MKKAIKSGIIYAVVIAVGIVVGFFLAKSALSDGNQVLVQAVGDTQNTPKMVQIVTNNAASTTYASFYNGDANDRVVTSLDFVIYASATSSLNTMDAGTSTIPVGTSSLSYLFHNPVATTSNMTFIATSSPWLTAAIPTLRIWPAGSYLNFVGNVVTTGYGAIKVNYIAQ